MGKGKKFSFKKILVLFIVLALPGICYYLLQEKGENRYHSLPIYGEKKLSGTYHSRRGKEIPDTLYHELEQFEVLDSHNKPFVFVPDSGIAVFGFFYLGNLPLANAINGSMAKVAERFSKNTLVNLYSITVDPENDDSQALTSYSDGLYSNNKRWVFLTAKDQQTVFNIANEGLLLDAISDPADKENIIHSSSLALVDSKGRIRGYYNVIQAKELDKLIDEIKLLLTEEIRNQEVSRSKT